MGLKILKDIEEIDGFKVIRNRGNLSWDEFDVKRKEYPIHIANAKGMISFKLQDGPIKEVGVNGCQIDTIIETAKLILEESEKELPCEENKMALDGLEFALYCLTARKSNREDALAGKQRLMN